MILMKWLLVAVLTIVMAVILAPVQAWLSLVQLPSSVVVVATRGSIFGGVGVVEFTLGKQAQTAKLAWQWCPGQGLSNWCVELNQSGLDLSGNVAYWGQDLLISSTSLSVTQDYQIPSLSPLVFDVEGAAAIDQLVIDLAGCENGYIKSAALKLNLVQAWIFGSAVGPTKINVNTSELVKIIAAKGDSIDANVRLQGLSYEVEAELSPPPALHSAMSLLLNARRSQNSVWVFNQQGNIPC